MSNYILFNTPLTSISSTAKEQLGAIRWEKGKCYKYIRFEKGSAADGVAYEIAYYDSTAGYENHLVTSDLDESDYIGAGVLQAALTDGDYGWIQIKGQATTSLNMSAGSAGDPLTPVGAADGTLDTAQGETETGSHICAVLLTTTTGAQIIICDFPF